MEEINDIVSRYIKSLPKYNGGECKVNCNCIEIEEFKNGGEPVQNYQCLDILNLIDKLKKTENESKRCKGLRRFFQ
jgi:hypothetical protein